MSTSISFSPQRGIGLDHACNMVLPEKNTLVDSIISQVSVVSQKILLSSGEAIEALQSSINNTALKAEDREVLQDFHQTVGLFQKSFRHACELAKKGNTLIGVPVCAQDLNQEIFRDILQSAKEDGVPTHRIILELKSDDSGVLNQKALKNIELLQEHGYEFALCDFVEKDGIVETRYLQKLSKRIIPKFVHISKKIMRGVKQGILKLTANATHLLAELYRKGVQILFSNNTYQFQASKGVTPLDPFSEKILQGAEIQHESIMDTNGIIHGAEGLIRFQDLPVLRGLNYLKSTKNTLYLVEKCIRGALSSVTVGRRRTVNTYLHDLGNPFFRQVVERNTQGLDSISCSFLVFEILEEKYGTLNSQVLDNLKWLKKKGFQIAIDDLYVSKNNPDGLSHEILDILIEEGIQVDFIKIDGRHSEGIRNGTILSCELQQLRQLIGQGLPSQSGQVYHPQYIVEWIQNRAHAVMIQESLGRDLQGDFWYQGRNINAMEFQR